MANHEIVISTTCPSDSIQPAIVLYEHYTMRILITGGSGFIGRSLQQSLRARGNSVVTLGRDSRSDFQWDFSNAPINSKALANIDAVIHLAGENVGSGRWAAAKKHRILESRVLGTRLLAEALAQSAAPPKVLLSASAIGFYGSEEKTILDEDSSAGSGFLANVCEQWEAATQPATDAGIRVGHLRLGVVLSSEGGILRQMRIPLLLYLGGRIGSGAQWMSWVALPDVIRSIEFVLNNEALAGPLNIVANTVTNAEFTLALANTLSRAAVLPMPAFLARLIFGEMADAMLLTSTRVNSKRLAMQGFEFEFTVLEKALDKIH